MGKKKEKRTQKLKKKKDRSKLWEQFDKEIGKKDNLCLIYDKQKVEERGECDKCGAQLCIAKEKFLTCSNKSCGMMYKDRLDESAEWRYYGADDTSMNDPTRCGMPINPLLQKSSYGCKVLCNNRSSYEMRKIRRYTEWQSMPYEEKTQYDEFEWIKAMARIAGIAKVIVDEALRQHKQISQEKTFRGFNRDGIIAASVYIACRIHNYPRTAKEIATIFHLDNTSATKGCKNAGQIINNIEGTNPEKERIHLHQTTPQAFIERYCSKLNINKEITKVCMFVAHKIEQKNKIRENTPNSVAAGIVYFIGQECNLNISKKNVSLCSEISEVTINKCYKKLIKLKTELIPPSILKRYAL
jgi:transcription initiation factor TFIIB|tara:strand:+ start:60 stop:1127 length:1068 start_codon:yes stop_codon:yes gene_type:complete